MTVWTPDRIAELTALLNVEPTLPYEEIGRRMGLNKNIVLGKAHRLGVALRAAPNFATATTTIARLDALDVFPRSGHCVLPIGHPDDSDFRFCGARVADPGRSYCDKHHSVVYTRASTSAAIAAGWTDERKAEHRKMLAARRGA